MKDKKSGSNQQNSFNSEKLKGKDAKNILRAAEDFESTERECFKGGALYSGLIIENNQFQRREVKIWRTKYASSVILHHLIALIA